ncbi:hypothetical protein EFK68_03810 [Pseudomonas aeruginosa]|nr:hypothetical protein EFK68_03810 [Pseudomonas aeruginosa]
MFVGNFAAPQVIECIQVSSLDDALGAQGGHSFLPLRIEHFQLLGSGVRGLLMVDHLYELLGLATGSHFCNLSFHTFPGAAANTWARKGDTKRFAFVPAAAIGQSCIAVTPKLTDLHSIEQNVVGGRSHHPPALGTVMAHPRSACFL